MLSLVALGLLAGQAVNAIPTITAKGSKFFTSDGNQFFIKGTYHSSILRLASAFANTSLAGVAYQLTPDDPLIDGTQCGLDASLMKSLGANTIRVRSSGSET